MANEPTALAQALKELLDRKQRDAKTAAGLAEISASSLRSKLNGERRLLANRESDANMVAKVAKALGEDPASIYLRAEQIMTDRVDRAREKIDKELRTLLDAKASLSEKKIAADEIRTLTERIIRRN